MRSARRASSSASDTRKAARHFKNKYDHTFTVESADNPKAKEAIAWAHKILKEERGIVFASPALEATTIEVEDITWVYVFYESGLSINVLYPRDNPQKRTVGFKLSEGMDVPEELSSLKIARQESKLPARSGARTSFSSASTSHPPRPGIPNKPSTSSREQTKSS